MKNPTRETQQDLEILYSKYQLLPTLREKFMELAVDYHEEDDQPFVAEALAQIYLHRQADAVTMVGILSPRYGQPQAVADKLKLLVELDFLDYQINEEYPDRSRFVVKYEITEDIERMLARYQYPLPMVIEPEKIKDNYTTGYTTIKSLVVLNGSSWFKDKDLCLDHLDRANSVALTFDKPVMRSEQASFTRPKRKSGEDFEEFQKRQKQATVFYETSVRVMEELDLLAEKFWLTHKYDRRGRVYASGYHVNTQGTDYNKAVIQLAKKEVVEG